MELGENKIIGINSNDELINYSYESLFVYIKIVELQNDVFEMKLFLKMWLMVEWK